MLTLVSLESLFGIWFNLQTNCGSTFSPTSTQKGLTSFMPPALTAAPHHGLPSLKQKISFVMAINGVQVQAPLPFGFKIGVLMA